MFWISDDSEYDSPMAPARGICNAIFASLAFWIVVGMIVYWW